MNCLSKILLAGVSAGIALMSGHAMAQKKYDVGASDTEIRIGNVAPYSGPASSYATIAKAEAAYFRMINEQGGINGRKINFITYDDGYSPPKTVEQARKLVESDEVLALFGVIGTAGNSAIQKYANQKKVPHLMVGSGASKWADPENFPWSMGWQPNYLSEARVYAAYILKHYPGKKVGILYQNDDFGKDNLKGLNEVFGADKSKIVAAEVSFEVTQPAIDSQIVQIKAASPDIFINIATPKFAAQAIKKIDELGWRPVHFITNVSVSIASVMKPAGIDKSQGILSASYLKDPNDPQWKDDEGMRAWRSFMTKYYPEGDQADAANIAAYGFAKGLVQILKQCGDDLTRANVMRQAASVDMDIEVYLPGIKVRTGPSDFAPVKQLQMMRFKGETWELFGPVLGGAD
jgi:branched-chain amino acid transport system substrate-binding protein